MAEINSRYSSYSDKVNNVNMLGYLIKRSTNCKGSSPKSFTKQLWSTAKDLYRKDLTAHYGCVNAIEFSSDGNLLFSGGDDRRVLMWDVNNAMMYYSKNLDDGAKPKIMRACHSSNIFCLAVDDENKRILSGSNDDQVIVHDYTTGNPVNYFVHDSPVFSLSLHPTNGNIFASAADNGTISIYDIRESTTDPLCLAKIRTPFHGVMFNPCEPCLIATANSKVGIHIWDLRKPKEALHECSDQQSMAVRWNQTGTVLLALRNLLPPVIYDPSYPKRKLEFDADGYYNACTMKSCSFAGENDEYVLSGSDDFNLYMWKIPEPWPDDRWISKAHLTLMGHRSIVNQVRFDPNKQLIASSGVEKIIKIWSPLRMPFSEGDHDKPSRKRSRVLCSSKSCSRSPGFLSHDYSLESVDEDMKMIHFFDSLLRTELYTTTPSQFCCVDGRLFPISSRRKESKVYEQLIIRKKKYLTKLLTRKYDDNPPVCSLSQTSNSRNENHWKKYHFSLEENEFLTASSDESSLDGSLDNSQEHDSGDVDDDYENRSPLNDTVSSVSPVPSDVTGSSSPLSTISSSSLSLSSSCLSLSPSSPSSPSSSSETANSHLESAVDPAYGTESQHSSDHLLIDVLSQDSTECGLSSNPSPRKCSFSTTESDDSKDVDGNAYSPNNFKDSGVNVSASSDSDNVTSSASFKKRRVNLRNRCYRSSNRKRASPSSSNSSVGESSSKRRSPSVIEEIVEAGSSSNECIIGTSDEKRINSNVNFDDAADVSNSRSDENHVGSSVRDENE